MVVRALSSGSTRFGNTRMLDCHVAQPRLTAHQRSSRTLTNTTAVHASLPSNTFAIYGNGEEKELTELVPGILNQLGPDSLASLRKLAESYQSMQKAQGEDGDKKDDEDDEDIPELVAGQDFESGDKKEEEADVE